MTRLEHGRRVRFTVDGVLRFSTPGECALLVDRFADLRLGDASIGDGWHRSCWEIEDMRLFDAVP
jgi:hypothetical protein